MRFYYEYRDKNGLCSAGHNLTAIKILDYLIELSGIDIIDATRGLYTQPWSILLDMRNIDFLRIIPMEEEEE